MDGKAVTLRDVELAFVLANWEEAAVTQEEDAITRNFRFRFTNSIKSCCIIRNIYFKVTMSDTPHRLRARPRPPR